jgi:hypothetical protein
MARTLVGMSLARATARRLAICWLHQPLLLRNVFDLGCHSSTLYTGRSSEKTSMRFLQAGAIGHHLVSERFGYPLHSVPDKCRVSSTLLDSPAARAIDWVFVGIRVSVTVSRQLNRCYGRNHSA